VEEPIVKRKLSREFKRAAVDRMAAGESPSALAKELAVKRELLYRWKEQDFGTKAGKARTKEKPSRHEQEVSQLKQRLGVMEQLVGKQAAELDFFAAALRNVKEPHLNKDVSSVLRSTARSNK
jgi:transposase